MNGIRETLIYRQQGTFFAKFREACLSGMQDRIFLRLAPPIPTWVLETVGFMVIPAALWIMFAFQDASMARITGVLTMIMLISWRVLPLLNRSLGALVSVRGLRHAALDCLALVEEIQASPAADPPEPDPDFSLRRSVAFDRVTFRYPKAQDDCLHDLSFTIPRGGKVGFIGQSGAGKTSIAAILSGLVEPGGGAMLVDGDRLGPAGQAAYCRRVGYVPQNPYILGGSLAENVAFSQWGTPWDEERVIRACALAEVDVLAQRGLDYCLGAGGAGLSGGQIQRLSIARALYAEPSVLILDEATSALDSGVEMSIMNTIFNLPQDMTIVIIAHRLSTVERCDTLFWIDGGYLKAAGPPADILPGYQEFLNARAERESGGTAGESAFAQNIP
jgi:ABC-type multidrug transport system fused ATPase/permease subunit